jgi:hypothetical protein
MAQPDQQGRNAEGLSRSGELITQAIQHMKDQKMNGVEFVGLGVVNGANQFPGRALQRLDQVQFADPQGVFPKGSFNSDRQVLNLKRELFFPIVFRMR